MKPRMQEGDDDDNRTIYIPYNSMNVLKDNHYLDGIWMDSQGLNHDKLDQTVRDTLAAAHNSKRTISGRSSFRRAKTTLAVRDYFARAESAACIYRNADAGHRWRGSDEYDAGFGDAADEGNWGGEGFGSAPPGHLVSIFGGGHGHHRRGRVVGDWLVVRGIGLGGAAYVL